MNKIIKKKKREHLNYKNNFIKEERLFIKQFPDLFGINYTLFVPRTSVLKVYNRFLKYSFYHIKDKEMFGIAFRVVMYRATHGGFQEDYKYYSRGWHYKNMFDILGIDFNFDINTNKLKLVFNRQADEFICFKRYK